MTIDEIDARPDFSALAAAVEADPLGYAPRCEIAAWLRDAGFPDLARGWQDGSACACGGTGGNYAQSAGGPARWVPCGGFACKVSRRRIGP